MIIYLPCFFVLRSIYKLVNDKRILHMASPTGYITPYHILYVDDIFVFL